MGWDGMRAGWLQESKEDGGIEIDLESSTTKPLSGVSYQSVTVFTGMWCSWLSRSLRMRKVSGSIPDMSMGVYGAPFLNSMSFLFFFFMQIVPPLSWSGFRCVITRHNESTHFADHSTRTYCTCGMINIRTLASPAAVYCLSLNHWTCPWPVARTKTRNIIIIIIIPKFGLENRDTHLGEL